MRQNFSRTKGKRHPSSVITRKTRFVKTERAKYPELAGKIVEISDIILEVLDSRFMQETRNAELEEKIKKAGKKIIYVLNKSDLINIKKAKEEAENLSPKVFVSCISRKGSKELRNKIKITSYTIEKPVDKRLNKITVGIIGYPNTGKSSVINLLSGKPAAGIGADAGFTKGLQKVNLTSGIVLVDSPGVISSKDYSSSDSAKISGHAKVGARSYSQVSNPEIVISNLMKEYSSILEKFYGIEAEGDAEMLIEKLGREKGFLKKGNQVDEDKTARLILKDWQEGRIKKWD